MIQDISEEGGEVSPERKAKILIVDDAQINRIILCELLGINIKF